MKNNSFLKIFFQINILVLALLATECGNSPQAGEDDYGYEFIPVTNIIKTFSSDDVRIRVGQTIVIPLTCSVEPNNATNQTIVWSGVSVLPAGFVNVGYESNSMSIRGIKAGGIIMIVFKATIADGIDEGIDFTMQFNIKVITN